MMRWAAGLEYLGGNHHGWQRQAPGVASLQAAYEAAFMRVANHPVSLSVAGRTDAGVHACNQVVHFDSDAERSGYAWALGANQTLPPELSVRWVLNVSADFEARHSATSRRYRYVIHNHRARSALCGARAAWIALDLDAGAMHRAAQALIGEHDFSAYRASGCQSATPIRRVHRAEVFRHAEFVVLDIHANAFLYHMVRNIAGVLIEIGQERQAQDWAAVLLKSGDRRLGPATAPAQGLYFVGADYPPQFGLPGVPAAWFPVPSPMIR